MSEPIVVSVDRDVGIIELARPDKFNCLSSRAWDLIDRARRDFEARHEVRVIFVRARGKNFCTGADLDEVESIKGDPARIRAFVEKGHNALLALEESSLPVIAAVQGLCLAGGMELMLGADIVFAANSARIGDQHAQYGLVPGWGGSQRLTRLVGLRRALEIMMSARWLDAREAHTIGLVNVVTADDELQDKTLEFVLKLTERSRNGLSEMKRLARDGISLETRQAMRLEADAAARHILSPDTAEGLAAFKARRKPSFP